MPSPIVRELVEKTHSPTTVVVGMNKAKAYRELQRRQGRLSKVWSEASSVTQSYDTSLKQTINRIRDNPGVTTVAVGSNAVLINTNSQSASSGDNSADHRNNKRNSAINSAVRTGSNIIGLGIKPSSMVETSAFKGDLFTKRTFSSAMFTVNKPIATDRPLTRERMGSSRNKISVKEPGRPVTAPETNAFATLDGPRQEVMVIPYYTKANSVQSNGSDPDSINGHKGGRLGPQRKPRHGMDLTQSINCNDNKPLKPHNQNEVIGDAIQYPAASKMREMLANDGMIVAPPKPLMTEHGNRSIIRKASQVSFISKTSSNSNNSPAQNAVTTTQRAAVVTASSQKTVVNKTPTVAKRPTQLPTQSSFPSRRVMQAKQVSFSDVDNSPGVSTAEDQILTLTTKNLNIYNAMVLKTIRTQKFDERIVQWVKERQLDNRSRIPRHDAIPEVDESTYNRESSHGRLTPTKRDHRGSTTPTDNDKSTAYLMAEHNGKGVPNSIQSRNVTFSYGMDQQELIRSDARVSPTQPKPSKETKLADSSVNENGDIQYENRPS